jgi:hypothetical protein
MGAFLTEAMYSVSKTPFKNDKTIEKEVNKITKNSVELKIVESKKPLNSNQSLASKLVNYNISKEDFDLAMHRVKSTYVTQNGNDLKEYAEDRDAFLQKLEKRQK